MEGKYPDLPLRFSWSLSSGKFLLPLLRFNFFPLWFLVWVCSVPKEALLLGWWRCWEVWEYLRGGHSWRKQAAGALPLKGMLEMGFSLCFHLCLPFPPLSLTPSSSLPSSVTSHTVRWAALYHQLFVSCYRYCPRWSLSLAFVIVRERERWNVISLLWVFFFILCCGRNQFYGLT